MYFIIFVPAILCLLWLSRGSTARAFLSVVLPVILFLPSTFSLRLPHLPPLTFQDTALLALGIGIFFLDIGRWRFSMMDLWVFMFIVSGAYAERLPWGVTGAWLKFGLGVIQCFVPYLVGKLLIEHNGMRMKTVQNFVRYMVIACIFCIPQFVAKINLYTSFWNHFFPGQWIVLQNRLGFGRVNGPYGTAEGAGMIFFIGLLLAAWLQYSGRLLNLKYAKVSVLILVATLLMTQSRGPWLAAIIAFSIASIGRAARPGRRAVLIFTLGLVVGIPLYFGFQSYISGKRTEYGSLRETAQYRRELLDNYIPFAKLGGAWGWGDSFPRPKGQTSVDNEYLLVWLFEGYVGLAAFLLIMSHTVLHLTRLGIRARGNNERYFVFTLLGILAGLAVCFATVWMSDQDYLLFFLLVGWAQAIRPAQLDTADALTHKLEAKEVDTLDSVLVYT